MTRIWTKKLKQRFYSGKWDFLKAVMIWLYILKKEEG